MFRNSKKRMFALVVFVFVLFFFFSGTVFAQQLEIQLLDDSTPIVDPSNITLSNYLQGLFRFGIGAAIVLSVLMITIGGLRYMTTDAASGKESGKDMVWSAVGGLVLALVSVLLLQTINPDLLSFRLIETIQKAGEEISFEEGGGGGGTLTGRENATRIPLFDAGIGIKNPPCAEGQTQEDGCTNVAGLPASAIGELRSIVNSLQYESGFVACSQENQSGCTLVITGGTEDGHDTHGVGDPFVDLRLNTVLDKFIRETSSCNEPSPLGRVYHRGSSSFVREGDHWHACLGTQCRIDGWTPRGC